MRNVDLTAISLNPEFGITSVHFDEGYLHFILISSEFQAQKQEEEGLCPGSQMLSF